MEAIGGNGGSNSSGGNGILGTVTISGGTVTAIGGQDFKPESSNDSGIYVSGSINITGGIVTAKHNPNDSGKPVEIILVQPNTGINRTNVSAASAKTGDSADLSLWVGLLIVSLGAFGGVTAVKLQRKKNEK